MTTGRAALAVALTAFAAACAAGPIGDPNAYPLVRLDRVFPYPSEAELAAQRIEVVLAAQYSDELPKARVGPAMKPVLSSLEEYLTAAGAGVIDRSIHDLASVRDELEAAEAGAGSSSYTGADWAIVARIEKFRRWSTYQPPSSLFKSEEDLAGEPGVCRHTGEVEVLLRAFRVPTDDVPLATWRLEHTGTFEQKQFDRSCPIDATRELVFLESIVEAALPCLQAPIQNGFAPRGYVEEHRRAASGFDIYRTSLGRRNGARRGLGLRIYRVGYETTRDGERLRAQRSIGAGRISEQLGESYSWMVVDPGELTQPILAGDLLRAVYEDPQASMLGLGICTEALSAQGRL